MSDNTTKIETNGINPIPESERYGKPSGLFPIWFSWNISIFGITLGVYIYSLGLSVVQAIVAGVLGYILSCMLVGIIAVPSVRMGIPSLTVSRCTFGYKGNMIPTLCAFVSNIGWQVIMLSMAFTTFPDLLSNTVPFLSSDSEKASTSCLAISFVVVIVLTMIGAVVGYSLILKIEKYIAIVTGVMTAIYLFFFIPNIDFSKVLQDTSTGTFSVFIGGVIMAMTMVGLGFLNYGGDYARYLPSKTNGGSVVFWTALGISLPVSVLLVLGVLLSVGNDALLSKAAHEPIAALTGFLPFWFYAPFSIVIVISFMSAGMTGIYSSGLALLNMGVPLSRATATVLISLLIVLGGIYITFISDSFLSTFSSFLSTISVVMGAWGAIMITDIFRLKASKWSLYGAVENDGSKPVNYNALIAIGMATFVGLGTITSADPYIGVVTGYLIVDSLQDSIFTNASMGVVLSMVISALVYGILTYVVKAKDRVENEMESMPEGK